MKEIKILIIILIITASLFTVYSEDEEKSSPVEFGLEIEDTYTYNSDSDNIVTGFIFNNDIVGSMSIPISFYTLTFWAEDELELEWSDSLALSSFFNSLYIGMDHSFNINDLVTLVISYEQDINFNISGEVDFASVPIISLTGEYDFGLSFEFTDTLSLMYAPYVAKEFMAEESYTGLENEIYAEIIFEFFHFFIPEGISCALHAEDTLTINVPASIDTAEKTKTITNEIEFGFDFSFYGFSPYIHLWLMPENYINYSEDPGDPVFYAGFTTGFEYSIDWISFGIDYTGQRNVFLLDHDKPAWENEIETWILISL